MFIFCVMNTRYGLSDKTWTCGLYHPNWLIYLFLAVFAFSSPFCYAKTAFSHSRALLSPCTPDLFMVKDVVKSEYRMIDMWSSVLGVVEAHENCFIVGEKTYGEQRGNIPIATCGQSIEKNDNYVVRMISSTEQRTASSFFCRCCIVTLLCQKVKR